MGEILGWIFAVVMLGLIGLIILMLFAAMLLHGLVYLIRVVTFVGCILVAVGVIILHPIEGPKGLLAGYREGKKNPALWW